MMLSKNWFTAIVSLVVLTAAVLGCRAFSNSICTAEIVFDGKSYKDSAGKEERAKIAACTTYCIKGDPFVGTVYMNWAKAQTDPEKRKMSIYEAMRADKTIAAAIRACTQRCSVDIEAGRLQMEMTCR